VIAARVGRVVAAMQDPFPQVAGGGFAFLRQAGIEVQSGILTPEARELNRAYLKAIETGLPWLTLKMAMTLDGKIATRTGDSRWITGEPARRFVHRLRDRHDAVLVGLGTARTDDPSLTARIRGARNPIRIVVDARAELSRGGVLATTASQTPTWIATTSPDAGEDLRDLGVQLLEAPTVNGRLDLDAVLRELVGRGVHSVLCEGGAELAASLLERGLVDELLWFIGPKIIAGRTAPGPVGGQGIPRMSEALELTDLRYRRLGNDLLIQARPKRTGRLIGNR
jgi:diaminohydroxyphosphoribosylaminopyrimidine deaminase/5-amino-6-(5-phosphoribosylamino)uracil reductase